jgi:hypothetical protein
VTTLVARLRRALPQRNSAVNRRADYRVGSRSTILASTWGGSPMPDSFQPVPSKCMLILPALPRPNPSANSAGLIGRIRPRTTKMFEASRSANDDIVPKVIFSAALRTVPVFRSTDRFSAVMSLVANSFAIVVPNVLIANRSIGRTAAFVRAVRGRQSSPDQRRSGGHAAGQSAP